MESRHNCGKKVYVLTETQGAVSARITEVKLVEQRDHETETDFDTFEYTVLLLESNRQGSSFAELFGHELFETKEDALSSTGAMLGI